jgi:DNA-binding XRE family transcriptional regulator
MKNKGLLPQMACGVRVRRNRKAIPEAGPTSVLALMLPRSKNTRKRKGSTTMTNLERIRKELGPARREKVKARAAQLIAEEMTLQELRRARKLTQVSMAKALGIGQDGVSKLEKRADLMISTLRKTVEAMGGTLSLVAEFPDRKPVVLSGIAEDELTPKPTGRKRAHVHA